MQRLADAGIKIVTFSQEELNAMAKKVRQEVWPVIKKDIGEDIFDRVATQLQ